MTWFPRAPSGRVIFVLGVFALCMGAIGIAQPAAQLQRMGFDAAANASGSQGSLLIAVLSLATINTALLYIFGACREWPGAHRLLIVTRVVMGLGLLFLALVGHAPFAFFAAAGWEWIGAALIAAARQWDRARRENLGHR